jgi:Zn-dependent protease with chaperone function
MLSSTGELCATKIDSEGPMYTTILCFLIAVSIHIMSPRTPEARWSGDDIVVALALALGSWGYLRYRFMRLAARVRDGRSAVRLAAHLPGLVSKAQLSLLLPFALLHYFTPFASTPVGAAERLSQTLGAFIGLLPLLVGWLVVWSESYSAQRAAHRGISGGHGVASPSITRREQIAAHAGLELPIIAPWFVLSLIEDAVGWLWPESMEHLANNPTLALLYAPVFILLAATMAPVLMAKLWRCRPLPPGETRELLETTVAHLDMRVRAILVWPLMGGRLLTAGVIGLVPSFRYLMFTPGLLSALSKEELQAVVAHEAGHVRHNHLWTYLLFFHTAEVAIIWGSIAHPELFKGESAAPLISAALTLGMIAIVVGGFRGIFGGISRNFERQADLNALEALGHAGPIISAFETISTASGGERDLPSWHHGSIAERVNFLSQVEAQPHLGAQHHRIVRGLKRKLWAGVALLAAASIAVSLPSVSKPIKFYTLEAALETRLASDAENDALWAILGSLRFENGEDAGALLALERAIALGTVEPEAYNSAAWILCVTEDKTLYDPHRAVLLAEKALALKPAPHILDTLAEARFRSGDSAGAIEAIEEALVTIKITGADATYYEKQRARFLTGK